MELRELLAANADESPVAVSVSPRLWAALVEFAEAAERAAFELRPSDFRTGTRQPAPLEEALAGLRVCARMDIAA
jgi:hypothetical protein